MDTNEENLVSSAWEVCGCGKERDFKSKNVNSERRNEVMQNTKSEKKGVDECAISQWMIRFWKKEV